ncbi:MAG: translation elongation factor Ts [Bryobacteraceae bacterium]
MAEINAQLVKQLREKTGAGMMECKKALQESNGDLPQAEIILRKRGLAAAGKKETRSTKQGLIASHITPDRKLGVLLEVNCESDFVARTEDFRSLAADIAAHIAEHKPKYVRSEEVTESERAHFKQHEALYEQKFIKDRETTIGELVKSKIAKLGENINVSRFMIYEAGSSGIVGSYIHQGSQIGVLLQIAVSGDNFSQSDEFRVMLQDLAMQVAAANPQYLGRNDVPADVLEKEREIQRDRARAERKPEKMLDKITEGRLSKFYEEVCLLEQPFIRENTLSVSEMVRTASAKFGGRVDVERFVRFKVGDAGDAPGVQPTPVLVPAS